MSPAQALLARLGDEVTLDAFLQAWRAGTLPKSDWTHAAHVAVCAWHAWPATPVSALVEAMRTGIRAYNDAVGTPNTATSGYHETLTRFWCERVAEWRDRAQPASRLDAVRGAVRALGEARALHREHYDFDVVNDAAARASWIPPHRVTTRDN